MLKKFTDDFGFMTVEDSAKLDSMSDGYVSQNDSRLSNDRISSGIRTSSTVVSVSSATAPTVGQVVTAINGTSAQWQTPVPSIAAGEVFYLDGYALPDGYQLTPTSQYTPGSEITLKSPISSGQTVVLGTFVSEVPIGEPFVQQGEWAFDTFISVDNNDGYVVVEIDGYSRNLSNIDTYLFSTTTPIITGNTSTLYNSNPFEGMFPVTSTDRLVIKYKAIKIGGSGTTVVTLYLQDNTNASHVHTPIGVAQYATGLQTATTVVSISSATAPIPGQVLTAISSTQADWEGDQLFKSDPTPLQAASGQHLLITYPVPNNTNTSIQVEWNCYSSGTSVVLGTTVAQVLCRGGTSTIVVDENGADFFDNTTGFSTPWAPQIGLSGNDIQVLLTADALTTIVPRVSMVVKVQSIADVPDPIPAARAALLATSPEYALDAIAGRTPNTNVSGTIITGWADQSTHHHDGITIGSNSIEYIPDISGNAALQWPAINGCMSLATAPTVSTNWTWCFRYNLNHALPGGIEVLLSDGPAAHNIVPTLSGAFYYQDGSGQVISIGTTVTGEHDYMIVVDATANTVTLTIDGVVGSPISLTPTAWVQCVISGHKGDNGGSFSIVGGRLSALYGWTNVSNAVANYALFRNFCQLAFGGV